MGDRAKGPQWAHIDNATFDVAIIGGGINGACLYHHLCQQGHRVLLIDKGDFASGTSQASAMWIWGGLLYLEQMDLPTVWSLCADRDRMLSQMPETVGLRRFRFCITEGDGRGANLVQFGLWVYWMFSAFRRARPCRESTFPEMSFLNTEDLRTSLTYEEAVVLPSDSQFVGTWIFSHQTADHVPLNYARVDGGTFDETAKLWRLHLTDTLDGQTTHEVSARCVVNTAGVWADAVNDSFGIQTPYRHLLSKGVFVGVERHPDHTAPLIFSTQGGKDGMALIPWGPIALWGPTETLIDSASAGYQVTHDDLDILLTEASRHLAKPIETEDIVSLRCGVRALVVDEDYDGDASPVSLSRKTQIVDDPAQPWITVYGGKLTGCVLVAKSVSARILQRLPNPETRSTAGRLLRPEDALETSPGLKERVASARWCTDREMCRTLADYLRRRTNIAQWLPRGGLGRHNEYEGHLLECASIIYGDAQQARDAVAAYQHQMESIDILLDTFVSRKGRQ